VELVVEVMVIDNLQYKMVLQVRLTLEVVEVEVTVLVLHLTQVAQVSSL
jgi:hypothetical protein